MISMNKVNAHSVDYKFDLLENFIHEFEEFGRKFFDDKSLKLGFRVFNNYKRVSLRNYLLDHKNDYGDFSIYFVRDLEFNTLDSMLNHEEYKNKIFLGKFTLDQLQGCCGTCVMFHSFVDVDLRGKGFGKFMTKLQKVLGREKHFSSMLCTDVINNVPQKKLLKRFGFESVFTFQNFKTKNYVELQCVNLNDDNYYDIIWKKTSSIFQRLGMARKFAKKTFSKIMIK